MVRVSRRRQRKRKRSALSPSLPRAPPPRPRCRPPSQSRESPSVCQQGRVCVGEESERATCGGSRVQGVPHRDAHSFRAAPRPFLSFSLTWRMRFTAGLREDAMAACVSTHARERVCVCGAAGRRERGGARGRGRVGQLLLLWETLSPLSLSQRAKRETLSLSAETCLEVRGTPVCARFPLQPGTRSHTMSTTTRRPAPLSLPPACDGSAPPPLVDGTPPVTPSDGGSLGRLFDALTPHTRRTSRLPLAEVRACELCLGLHAQKRKRAVRARARHPKNAERAARAAACAPASLSHALPLSPILSAWPPSSSPPAWPTSPRPRGTRSPAMRHPTSEAPTGRAPCGGRCACEVRCCSFFHGGGGCAWLEMDVSARPAPPYSLSLSLSHVPLTHHHTRRLHGHNRTFARRPRRPGRQ